ncbi:MAG: beta-ketoacyl-ACP synthase III [Flavobacteriaceae bacterium]|nr:beta-ketoacyl-ACP synthase III [Flavobacteriaceae bacterium]
MKEVYITKTAKFLPNEAVENDAMEEILGCINDRASIAKRIVLRNNQIKKRYYALDKQGNPTHNNAALTQEAVMALFDEDFKESDAQLLSCGTASPDQLIPSHAAMVHGLLPNSPNLEINAPSGACCSGMNALKYGYMAVRAGLVENAICTGSERPSTWFLSNKFDEEVKQLEALEEQPIIAFHKEFLRWMLSDGAGAFLLKDKPEGDLSFKIEWMEGYSYANELESCMYNGADKLENGSLRSWSEYTPMEWMQQSIFALKQDAKLLGENILVKGVESMKWAMEKHQLGAADVDYYLPHISSYYFKERLYNEMVKQDFEIGWDNWFMNLYKVGNVGAASIYLMLEELAASNDLKKGDRILLSVPESARFSYAYAYLTVC